MATLNAVTITQCRKFNLKYIYFSMVQNAMTQYRFKSIGKEDDKPIISSIQSFITQYAIFRNSGVCASRRSRGIDDIYYENPKRKEKINRLPTLYEG